MNNLENARDIINEIDCQMASLFEKRMNAVKQVLEYKKENNLPIFDPIRESEVIKRNLKLIQNEDLKIYYQDYLEMLMEISKAYQEQLLDE